MLSLHGVFLRPQPVSLSHPVGKWLLFPVLSSRHIPTELTAQKASLQKVKHLIYIADVHKSVF